MRQLVEPPDGPRREPLPVKAEAAEESAVPAPTAELLPEPAETPRDDGEKVVSTMKA